MTQGAQQPTGDEGLYLTNGKVLCLWKYETLETVSKFDWHLGRYEPSSPSTKEFHGDYLTREDYRAAVSIINIWGKLASVVLDPAFTWVGNYYFHIKSSFIEM